MRKTLLVVLLVALLAVPCWAADETGLNVSAEKGETTEAAQAIANKALAEQLAELGRAQKSPMLLASAAEILNGVGTFEEKAQEKVEEGKAAEGAKEKATTIKNTSESLYAEAVAMAKDSGDDALVSVLENKARIGGTKGLVSGATVHYDRVYGTDTYNLRFNGGRLAEIGVVGDGDDVDLYVYDSNGNLIERDIRSGTECYVSWTPRWTGNFRVEVVNASDYSYIDYGLITN